MLLLENPGKKLLFSFGLGVVSAGLGLHSLIVQTCSALGAVFGVVWIGKKLVFSS